MRLQTTITDLTADQWDLVQRSVKTEYDFAPGASRVCLAVEHDGEERHAEMPLGAFMGLLTNLAMSRVVADMKTAMADLTPDGLPDTEAGQGPLPGGGYGYGYDRNGNIVALDQDGNA